MQRVQRVRVFLFGLPFLAALLTLASQAQEKNTDLRFASAKESRAEYDRTVGPFFAKHCNSCHNSKKAEGDLVLEKLDPDMKESTSAGRWALLLDKLASREMPPEGKPRPSDDSLLAVIRWIQAELKRSNKHTARRAAHANGNVLAHRLLFDPRQSAGLDAPTRVRLLSPEIYSSLTSEVARGVAGIGQPFSPLGGTTFKDMGAPKPDEPVTAQLLANALVIVERQTAVQVKDGKTVPAAGAVKELVALLDESRPLGRKDMETAINFQFGKVLGRKPSEAERARFVAFMRLEAQASGKPVSGKRFVFVVESNGVPPDQLAPSGIKRSRRQQQPLNGPAEMVDISLKDRELPFSLEPIKAWKDRVTIIQGLSGRICGGGHSNNFGALGCFPTPRESTAITGPTIDGALARTVPGIFPHIGLGISKRLENSVIYNISAWDRNKGLPTMCKPDQAYSALFGSVAGGDAQKEFAARNNLLDFLKEDVKKVQSNLAGEEKEQLGAYLETFETLRNRQSRLNEIEHTLREKGPVPSDKYKSAVETDRLDAMFDIGAAALVCGLTNVLTLSSAAGIRDFDITFKGLGLNIDKHSIGHGKSFNGKTWADLYNIIRRYHFDLIAGLMKKLEKVKEGNGTMLDNTIIVYLSDGAEGHHSRCWEWPMVVIGNIGKKLKTGRYLDYPGYGRKGHRTTANLYVTLLQLAGANRESFGVPDPLLKDLDQSGPLVELLA